MRELKERMMTGQEERVKGRGGKHVREGPLTGKEGCAKG